MKSKKVITDNESSVGVCTEGVNKRLVDCMADFSALFAAGKRKLESATDTAARGRDVKTPRGGDGDGGSGMGKHGPEKKKKKKKNKQNNKMMNNKKDP